ncbi:hypothetical protein Pcac1_g477 [Phytophthora cactorum]|uniref:Transmembrane protein n=1 Tax=Phytophthora cactorum TaxID=29920 RepID=A0A329SZM2_9STRA|nr:hypothetical protein Pcac1_g477 [Phytophthora cactorum]RAW41336.1 hypothetical protein PC110_g2450 [Phytophthora cactorum]
MRTSGGAGASLRRLRDAPPGHLHPLPIWLLILLLLCSLVAAEPASQPAQQRREWSPQIPLESQVTVGADGIATSRGAGRRRSDGLSITRSIPVDTGIAPDAAVDDQAIKFTPARVDLGRVETCSPQRYYVGVENRGRVSVRLDGADFTHEGFSLANDVRGIRLDPGDRFNVQFVFLPSEEEPKGVDAHLRVLTTSGLFSLPISSSEVVTNRYGVRAIRASVPVGVRFGQSLQFINPLNYTIRITEVYALDSFVHIDLLNGSNWIGSRWPREDDDKEAQEVPGEYDPQFDYIRRADRGAWDMPAGTTSPLIKVSLQKNMPAGVYFTFIHIAADKLRLLMVPVRITVLKPGIHIEPKELDLGMLTDLHDDVHREVSFTLYNTGLNPIEILELKVLESNLIVSAELWGRSSVIPPRTQVSNALAIQIRVDKEITGNCFASLMLKTNASSSELGQRRLKLYGRVAHGNVAFQLNETRFGVIFPLENVLREENDGEDCNNTANENGDELEMSATKLVSIIGENSSRGIMAGTTALRKLQLWNQFDCPVELQRVWVDSALSDQDGVSVYRFKQGVVPAGFAWPKISLQITPPLERKLKFLAPRTFSLMVETNVSRHRIQISVYYGFLNVNSTRGLQNYSVSGYFSDSHILEPNSSQSCLVVPKGGLVTGASPRIDGGQATTNTQAVRICQSLLFDLEKVASHRSRTEVVKMVNENPVPVTLKITNVSQGDIVGISIKADVTVAHPDAFPDASISNYWSNVAGNDSTGNSTKKYVRVGDSFVLQPGYQVEFSVNVMAQDILGELTVPVITVETPIEIFHLYVRLRSVQGTIEPVTPAIVLPSMFPGRTQVIHIHYRNTFEHAVTPLMATISSSNLKILSMRDAIAPKRVESVLDVLFSPAESSKCSDAVFLVDCLIPLPDTVHEQACEQLSDYGEFVDKRDLEALRRRDAFWGKMQESDHQSTVEAQVHLQTDIMEDVAEVTIKALLERPVVTASLHLSNNASRMIERTEFELTELLDRSYVFINVRNPSNISIQMELTIAETDQTLFYSCSEELNEDERSDHNRNGDTEDNSEGISALCLAEWKAATADAVALQRDRHVDIYVPPFYVQRRIIQVSAGEEAQLGPIYYLPSKVQEVATTVFVRNDLSHIEPVQLLARSGKGTLDLLVDTPADSSKPRFDEENIAEDCALFGCNGILHFSLTHDDALTDYTQDAGFLLSNTGPFGLVVRTMNVEPPSWTSDAASRMSDFLVTLEEFPGQNDKNGKVVLSPGTTARFRVSFRASCFAARVASWLIIDTSDTIKRIQLQGTITTDAAFSCLRSRMAPPLRNACLYAWIIAAMVTVITMLYTVLLLVYDAWTHEAVPHVQLFNLAAKTDSTSTEMATNEDITFSNMEGEGKLPPLKLASFNRLLEDMEQTAFTPSARVVTPAVSHLLEQRRKGLHSSVRTGNVHVNEGKNATVPLAANAKPCENEAISLSLEAERISPSNMASTITEPSFSLRDVQEEAENESGASNLSASAPQNVFSVIKLLEDINDRKRSELSSDERSSESPASSSHSSIVQPDAEESSRDAHFPQLSFGSLDDQRKLGTGSALHAAIDTNSTKTAEEAFEAFKSLSTRWRSEDWQNNLNEPPSPSLSGNFSDWNGTLSLNTLGNGLLGSTDTGNQRDETVRSGNRSESSSFIGAAPRLYLNEFAAFDAPGARLSTGTTPKSTSKKAPPGFTPADAKPLEARAAFERLRSRTTPSVPTVSSSNDGFGGNSVFASKLPLFGPALPPTNDDRVMLGSVGRIGSGRLKGLHGLDAPTK